MCVVICECNEKRLCWPVVVEPMKYEHTIAGNSHFNRWLYTDHSSSQTQSRINPGTKASILHIQPGPLYTDFMHTRHKLTSHTNQHLKSCIPTELKHVSTWSTLTLHRHGGTTGRPQTCTDHQQSPYCANQWQLSVGSVILIPMHFNGRQSIVT